MWLWVNLICNSCLFFNVCFSDVFLYFELFWSVNVGSGLVSFLGSGCASQVSLGAAQDGVVLPEPAAPPLGQPEDAGLDLECNHMFPWRSNHVLERVEEENNSSFHLDHF